MIKRQKIFKVLSTKWCEEILMYIHQEECVSFKEICQHFNNIKPSCVRLKLNMLVKVKLIKSIKNHTSINPRGRGYVIPNLDIIDKIKNFL